MSKADTAGTEGDRQRVLMQITQELCRRPGLSRAGFDMPTIYIPDLTGKVLVMTVVGPYLSVCLSVCTVSC